MWFENKHSILLGKKFLFNYFRPKSFKDFFCERRKLVACCQSRIKAIGGPQEMKLRVPPNLKAELKGLRQTFQKTNGSKRHAQRMTL